MFDEPLVLRRPSRFFTRIRDERPGVGDRRPRLKANRLFVQPRGIGVPQHLFHGDPVRGEVELIEGFCTGRGSLFCIGHEMLLWLHRRDLKIRLKESVVSPPAPRLSLRRPLTQSLRVFIGDVGGAEMSADGDEAVGGLHFARGKNRLIQQKIIRGRE